MNRSFQEVLDQIRSLAQSEAHKGRLFERLMKTWFRQDPVYSERFAAVWLWSEWAARRPDFDGADFGIDLVAEERGGGYCAVQCKCHAPGTRIAKPHLDSFIAASARQPFTARLVVDTGDAWGPNAVRTVKGLTPRCSVIRVGGLLDSPFDWPDLAEQAPEDLVLRERPFRLRPHQQAAFDEVVGGFAKCDRGKLLMACGTGKTFTALRIAEAMAGTGGRALYLVPSISLFSQAMREWATQKEIPHRYIGICSDHKAGRQSEDASFEELELPVTTAPEAVTAALRESRPDAMTVVFCTYQSLPIVEAAQREGAPPFDLALCDEAHRTTGIEREEGKRSAFALIHDETRIRVRKRLYMTATARLYTEAAKRKAARHDIEVFSMDDPATYGPELHRLSFSTAVEADLLSDYRVVILTLSERAADPALGRHLASADSEIDLSDATRIVGCWRALQNPENEGPEKRRVRPLERAIAFTNTIRSSKRLAEHWGAVVESAVGNGTGRASPFPCEVRHVDGQHHALERRARLEWLRGSADSGCRILSNARCLTEGIDVPALDAVLFMSPRNSQVDIVQAVGRAMRKAPGKQYGYIVLPVAIPAGTDPAAALDDNERFAAVWAVLRALRSHDDRLDAEIQRMDLNRKPSERILFSNGGADGDGEAGAAGNGETPGLLPFPPLDLPPGAIFARIVEKCGDRKYWETWAQDVAAIFARLVGRIEGLLANPENEALGEWFDGFLAELRASTNDSIRREHAVEMMAQHLLTGPVFEALFEDYDFAAANPVARALDRLRRDFGEFGLENETRDLEKFYESVRKRAAGLDNAAARQRVLMELYEKFFATALKKEADRLGIVYTPVEVVDFLLESADHLLRTEFGRSLSDEGVHVLDPFTGTGIFLVRLLQSERIRDADLERKYRSEFWANEIVLLAYYIATVHIEEAFRGRRGEAGGYEPFGGIALTDTFNLRQKKDLLPGRWLPDNSERVARQQRAPIEVIVGNPPWSAGQRSASDDNPNVAYPELERRVADTYAARSRATLKNSLYDTYKMAIRWASDRIGKRGVIAFVTNGSWIDGNVDSGVRACLVEEFSSIWVLNLRGNARTSGQRRRAEGDNAFGQGSRAPVAITILVRNPKAAHAGCRIRYRDIGDYLTRKEKFAILRDTGSIAGIGDWQLITPNRHHDWISQRSEAFRELVPVGSKDAKAGRSDEAIFRLFSNGYKTGRDAYACSFSRAACAENARRMVADYRGAAREIETRRRSRYRTGEGTGVLLAREVDEVTGHYSGGLRWDRELRRRLRQSVAVEWSAANLREVLHRPFVKQFLYADEVFSQAPAQTARMFPPSGEANRAICVSGVGSLKPFAALVVDTLPDLELVSKGQCFPRYSFEPRGDTRKRRSLLGEGGLERRENIPDAAVRRFREHYRDEAITGDAIFDYVYGVLHAPAYRDRFANDLAKELPRVPFAPDFHAFAAVGRKLAALHLGYETCDEYPLPLTFTGSGEPAARHFRLDRRGMRFADAGRTELVVNEFVRLGGIPAAAHRYEVNGRTPLGWFLDRYRITRDRETGIVNDPNAWFPDPRDLIARIRRIVHLGVETARLVDTLPDPFPRAAATG